MTDSLRNPERIAVCRHPNGEGVWWDADKHGSGCIQDCDCTPAEYVRADVTPREVTARADVARVEHLQQQMGDDA